MEQVKTVATTVIELKRPSLVPTDWEDNVRMVAINESTEAGRSLAYSFCEDPLSLYLLDGDDMHGVSDESRWKLHVDLMTYVTAAHALRGAVTTIGADSDAIALWMTPGTNMDDWWTLLRSGMWRLYFQLSAESQVRLFREMLPLLHDTKAEVMGERDNDSYYLVYIGTKATSRGRGYAKKLMLDMIGKADAENRAMYLESTSSENNIFYGKLGFELKRDITLKRGRSPVVLYIMVREPRVGCLIRIADSQDTAGKIKA